jgi:rsbT antagonist protein RsbS
MTIPIIKVGQILIATVPEDLEDSTALELQEAINARIEKTAARGVLLDVSALQTVDSFLGRLLTDVAAGAQLLGADTVVAGMQPAVAITLVELGLGLKGVRTALDAEQGLHFLQSGRGRRL